MKKQFLLVLAACGLSSAAMAGGLPVDMSVGNPAGSECGVYVGLGAGYGLNSMVNGKNDGFKFYDYGKTSTFAGRVFLGYDINRYFAVEAGYSHFFTKPELRSAVWLDAGRIYASRGKFKLKKSQAIDLMGKIKAPVCDGFDLYAKLGGNYLMSEKNSFNVGYGAGIDWNITNNVVAGLEWLRFNGNKDLRIENKKDGERKWAAVSHADAVMLTIRYKFDI